MTQSDKDLLSLAKAIREALKFQQRAQDLGCPAPELGLCNDRVLVKANQRVEELLQKLLSTQ